MTSDAPDPSKTYLYVDVDKRADGESVVETYLGRQDYAEKINETTAPNAEHLGHEYIDAAHEIRPPYPPESSDTYAEAKWKVLYPITTLLVGIAIGYGLHGVL